MREFKFFHGLQCFTGLDETIEVLSAEISRQIDAEILRTLLDNTTDGDNLNYLNHYINMGGGNRA